MSSPVPAVPSSSVLGGLDAVGRHEVEPSRILRRLKVPTVIAVSVNDSPTNTDVGEVLLDALRLIV